METLIYVKGIAGLVVAVVAFIGAIIIFARAGHYLIEKKVARINPLSLLVGLLLTMFGVAATGQAMPIMFPEFTAELVDAYENITGREIIWVRNG